jgi:trehalose 6-phosphate phosphatase
MVARVAGWKSRLLDALPKVEGIVLEDKRASLSVHYRCCASPAIAAELIRRAAADLPGARLVGGKCVLNILPEGVPDKGDALMEQLRASGTTRAIFLGDDVTDEAVFRINAPQTLLTVRVGYHPGSRASHYVGHRDEVDTVLETVARLHQQFRCERVAKGA